MKSKIPFTVSTLAATLLSTFAAFAQETTLDTVTVTSTTIDDRFAGRRGEVSSTTAINGSQVDERRPQNIINVLQSIPGITADLSSGDEIKIKFRGVENQMYMGEKPGVAIVIDGVPVYERTGKVNIDLDNIESIKIIKGGASYLFGEDALSGAVVITTKRGAKYAGVTLGLDKGAWNYERTLARVGLAGDWGSGHIQATRRTSDDYYFQSPYTTGTLDGSLRFNLGERTDATLNFEQSRRNKDKHGNVTGASQAEGDPTGTVGRDFARKFNVDLDKINLTLAHDLAGGGNLLGTVYQYKDHTIFWSSPQNYSATGTRITDVNAYTTLNNYRQTQNGAKGEWRHKFSNLAWMTGIDLRHNEYKNYNTALTNYCSRPGASCTVTPAGTIFQNDKTDEKTRAFYGELKWMPLTDWVFTANARNDFIDLHYKGLPNSSNTNAVEKGKTFSVNSWRLGANWSLLPNVSLFSNISTGFRTPTAQQLYGGSISPTGSTRNNENLKPETATNYEIGTNASSSLLGIGYNIQASLFQIERKNYIMSVNGDYGQSNTTYQQYYDNIGGVRNRGLELALKTDAKREWSLDVAYTYVDARFTNYDNLNRTLGNPYATGSGACNTTNTPSNTACRIARANVTGNTVPRVPRHQLFSTLHWHPASGLQIGLEMDAKSDAWADEINQEKIPGRTLFNLGMTYDLSRVAVPLIGGKWSFFARVDNLFDRKYWTTARGTNDAASNYGATPGVYNGIYDANDLSIITGKPRAWMAGITASF